MKFIKISDVKTFLDDQNFDLRLSNNGRWIDQKVTYDVLSFIADCLIEFVDNDTLLEFSAKDIWNSDYAKMNIPYIFNKPNVDDKSAENEYDKFFSQPLLLLANSKVLNLVKRGNKNFYTINNYDILYFIASREINAHQFLVLYIEKVLKDSGIWNLFENFFEKQDKSSFAKMKDGYILFMQNNTPIKGDFEPKRIFAKVINPLSIEKKKLGSNRGYLSKNIISLTDMQYNKENLRDIFFRHYSWTGMPNLKKTIIVL